MVKSTKAKALNFILVESKLNTGDWIQDAGYRMLDSGYWIQDAGYRMLDSGYWKDFTVDLPPFSFDPIHPIGAGFDLSPLTFHLSPLTFHL